MESTFVNFNKNNALSKKSKLQNNKYLHNILKDIRYVFCSYKYIVNIHRKCLGSLHNNFKNAVTQGREPNITTLFFTCKINLKNKISGK